MAADCAVEARLAKKLEMDCCFFADVWEEAILSHAVIMQLLVRIRMLQVESRHAVLEKARRCFVETFGEIRSLKLCSCSPEDPRIGASPCGKESPREVLGQLFWSHQTIYSMGIVAHTHMNRQSQAGGEREPCKEGRLVMETPKLK